MGRTVAAHAVSAGGVALAVALAITGSSSADGMVFAWALLLVSLVTGGGAVALARVMLDKPVVTPWLLVGVAPALVAAFLHT